MNVSISDFLHLDEDWQWFPSHFGYQAPFHFPPAPSTLVAWVPSWCPAAAVLTQASAPSAASIPSAHEAKARSRAPGGGPNSQTLPECIKPARNSVLVGEGALNNAGWKVASCRKLGLQAALPSPKVATGQWPSLTAQQKTCAPRGWKRGGIQKPLARAGRVGVAGRAESWDRRMKRRRGLLPVW